MSTRNAKTSSGGEEEAPGTRNVEQNGHMGEMRRGQVILGAYLIATLELTFLFMQIGVMPVCRSFWHPKCLNSLLCLWKCLLSAHVHLHQHPPPLPLQAASSVHAWVTSIFVPAYVGLVGSLLNIIIAMVWIPLQTKPTSAHGVTEHSTSEAGSMFSIREILRLMKFPGVTEVFIVKVFAGLPIGFFLIMFSIISMDFFGLEAVESGYLMSYFGVLQMVVQGLVVGKLTTHFTERTLLRLSVFVFAGVGLAMALMRTVWHYCIIAVPLVFAFSLLGTITDSILTKAVPSSDTGTMLGICASVQPLTRTVGPTIGGVLYKQFGVSSFGYLQLIVNIGLFVYLLKSKIPLRELKSQ
ncbi:solute carrier family 22 member 18 isoform X2 [Calypte anna]|uniref:solute carrier family 22 member 18 isoform X2 n=1 Tax=Calypte anna TaxID=9244 RepID=UPI0011C3E956|nr:solute carrier family 22 member 18 isoform X2 [Calypte anna]